MNSLLPVTVLDTDDRGRAVIIKGRRVRSTIAEIVAANAAPVVDECERARNAARLRLQLAPRVTTGPVVGGTSATNNRFGHASKR